MWIAARPHGRAAETVREHSAPPLIPPEAPLHLQSSLLGSRRPSTLADPIHDAAVAEAGVDPNHPFRGDMGTDQDGTSLTKHPTAAQMCRLTALDDQMNLMERRWERMLEIGDMKAVRRIVKDDLKKVSNSCFAMRMLYMFIYFLYTTAYYLIC